MTIHDFSDTLPAPLLKRGREYVTRVGNIAYSGNNDYDQWRAAVQGTADYNVTVQASKGDGTILFHRCSCPYNGEICKHVIAVLYKLSGAEGEAKAKRRSKTMDKVAAVLGQLSPDDMRSYLRHTLLRDRQLAKNFLSMFASKVATSTADYKALIDDALAGLRPRHGFVHFHAFQAATQPITTLVASADRALHAHDLRRAAAICQAVIEKLVPAQHTIDDSDGVLSGLIKEAFTILFVLTEHEPEDELRDELFSWASKKSVSSRFLGTDASWELAEFAATIASEQHEHQLRKMVLALKQHAKAEPGEWISRFNAENSTRVLLQFFFKHKSEEEIMQLIEANIQYPGIRMIALNKFVKEGDLQKAVEIAKGGVTQAMNDKAPGTVNQWRQELLKLYGQLNDVANELLTANQLFFNATPDVKIYRLLCRKTPPAEWPLKRSELIKQFFRYRDYYSLAEIHSDERDYAELLRILKLASSVELLRRHEAALQDYKAELQQLYFAIVAGKLKQGVARGVYRECAQILVHAREKYNKAEVLRFAAELREQYRLRPALVEEFGVLV